VVASVVVGVGVVEVDVEFGGGAVGKPEHVPMAVMDATMVVPWPPIFVSGLV
jgi:hypothetical protein